MCVSEPARYCSRSLWSLEPYTDENSDDFMLKLSNMASLRLSARRLDSSTSTTPTVIRKSSPSCA